MYIYIYCRHVRIIFFTVIAEDEDDEEREDEEEKEDGEEIDDEVEEDDEDEDEEKDGTPLCKKTERVVVLINVSLFSL